MKEIVYTCDRCRAKYRKDDNTQIEVIWSKSIASVGLEADLCLACATELSTWRRPLPL